MKQESKRVNVPDIRDLIQFWGMKDEIMDELLELLKVRRDDGTSHSVYMKLALLIGKIESIGKKDN